MTAEVVAIVERFGDIEYRKDLEANRVEHGELVDGFSLPRTDRQRRFDAMIAIFGAAATAGDTATPAVPLVNIVIDATTWGRMLLAAGLSTDTDLDGRRVDPFTDHPNPGHPDGDEPDDDGHLDRDDRSDDDTPEEVARLTSLARTRLDTLTRPRTA